MKTFVLLACGAVALAGCAAVAPGNTTSFLNNGNDISFVNQGSTSCPGVIESGNPIYERYPLRCGPQQQVIPR